MLEKPDDVSDDALRACLRDHFGVHAAEITFLPIGNDVDTAAYRVVGDDATPSFLKLRSWRRSGRFDVTTVRVPRFLHDRGIEAMVAPIRTRAGRLWARFDAYAAILFPFIAGQDGFTATLSERQWVVFGAALRAMHTLAAPSSLRARLPAEDYGPRWRDDVRAFQTRVETETFAEPVAAAFAAFLRARRDEITHLVTRAETLAGALRANPPALVLCHADIHGGNVIVGADDTLAIVDWDTVMLAPKERDLMFIGGGIGKGWNGAGEETWFYRGYGAAAVDPVALTYHRYERIVADIVAFAEQLLLTDEGGADRPQALRYFVSQFDPGDVVDIAVRTDAWLRAQQSTDKPAQEPC